MPKFLRALNRVKGHTWTETVRNKPLWCPDGDVPAQLLADWADNSLPVWQISDDEENLEDVIVAFT